MYKTGDVTCLVHSDMQLSQTTFVLCITEDACTYCHKDKIERR